MQSGRYYRRGELMIAVYYDEAGDLVAMKDDKPAGNPQVNLRIPDELGPKLIKDAKKSKRTVQAVILSIIAAHYGVVVSAPQRGRPNNEVRELRENKRRVMLAEKKPTELSVAIAIRESCR